MRVFVTGGSGFVGGHVIEALAGHEVLAMARSEASARVVEGFGARAIRASLEDVDASHLEGVDAVVHAAAFVDEYGPEEVYVHANVDGTQRLLDAARAAGVKRFVLVSTNATVLDFGGQRDVDETAPYTTDRRFHYGRTKAEAERRVLAADAPDFTTIAIRPCFVWGPRDNSVLPALRRMAENGTYVWLDGGRALVSTTHVDNLVHAIERALVSGRGGQAYFVADDGDVDMRTFLDKLAADNDFTLPRRSVPSALVRPASIALEAVWGALGLRGLPPITYMAAHVTSADMTVSSDKARRELGWRPVVTRADAQAA